MSRIYVTGATGFIGSNLTRSLIRDGHEVVAMALKGTHHPYLKNLRGLILKEGNVLDFDSVKKSMKGCDHAYHLAGMVSHNRKDFNKLYAVHVEGTKNVLLAAMDLGLKKVTYTGTVSYLGFSSDNSHLLNEDDTFDENKLSKFGYEYTKWLAELEALKAYENGLDVSITLPAVVYGQGDFSMYRGEIFRSIKSGRVKAAFPGGNGVVSVDDIVDAHKLVMQKGKPGRKYIFSNENLESIKIINTIARTVGRPEIKKVLPKASLQLFFPIALCTEKVCSLFGKRSKICANMLTIASHYRYYDSTKARRELGWKPKVSFEEAVEKAVAFYRENNLI